MEKSRKQFKEWLCLRNVIDFPPLWTVLIIVIGIVLSRYTISLTLHFPLILIIGIVLAGLSFGLMIWCAVTLVKSRTPALPHNKAETLVTKGPYRWSRNPIYLADIVLLISFAFIYKTLWPILLVPVLYWILQKRFVLPEENMLKEHFSEAFTSWSQRTRRWI